jgi:hypothetical protein
MASWYEIGGVIMDGSYGYDHRRFMRLRRAILKDKPVVVGDIATHLVLDFVKEYGEVEVEFERSERLQALEDWGQKWKRTSKRLAAPLPMSVPIKLAVAVIPELAIAYSRGVGSYDLRTPEVQRYEESVHFGGSGGMII